VDAWTEQESEASCSVVAERESVTAGRDAADMGHRLEELSNELKSRTCVLPRRTVQLVNTNINIRTLRSQEKSLRLIRLKEENRLRKVVEITADCQIVNYLTLLCRKGYYIYTLRRLLI